MDKEISKPLIVMFPPTNEFDSGIKTYCKNLEKVYDYSVNVIEEENESFENYDFTLIAGYTKPWKDLSILDKFPKPIIFVAHDIQHYIHSEDIVDFVDGFVVSMDKTKEWIEKRKYKPVIKIRQPFVPYCSLPDLSNKENIVISTGRIVAERGHRHAAELGDLGYNVIVAGSHVKHHEYDEYYKRVEKHHNVKMVPDPTDQELMDWLAKSKIIMSFYYVEEKYPSVYYALLEPISLGCVPVLPYWNAYNCILSGLQVCVAESSVDAAWKIENLFNNENEFIRITKMNRKIVEHWSDDYIKTMDYFIKENFSSETFNY